MAELSPDRRRAPAAALILARVVYALNWYNVGAVLPAIGLGLSAGTAQLGLILGAFLLGVGIFQLPAGFAALRFGSRRVSLAGLLVFGTSCALTIFVQSWPELAALRFAGGAGAAFFFSPALSLIASYYPAGRRGPVIGLYNGGFSAGGAIGLLGGAFLGQAVGWALSLTLAGIVLVMAAAGAALLLPRQVEDDTPRRTSDVWRAGVRVLTSRSIWALSIGLTGFWAVIYVVAQYFVTYGDQVHPEWGLGATALLATTVVIVSLPGGPFGGWLAEQGPDRRLLAGGFGALAGLLTMAIPFLGLAGLAAVMVTLGFVDGLVFAILYLIPSYLPEIHGDGLALGVAVVNSIQVILGGGVAIAFGFVVSRYGYTLAWEGTGLLAIVLTPLLLLVAPNRAWRPRPGRAHIPAE